MTQVAMMKKAEVVKLLIEEDYDLVAAIEMKRLHVYTPEEMTGGDLAADVLGWLFEIATHIISAAKRNVIQWMPHGIYIGAGEKIFTLLKCDVEANGWAYQL